jgi:hypothetical protein
VAMAQYDLHNYLPMTKWGIICSIGSSYQALHVDFGCLARPVFEVDASLACSINVR